MLKLESTETKQTFDAQDLAALPGQIVDIASRLPGREGSGVLLASVLTAAGISEGDTLILTSGDGSFQTEISRSEAAEALLVYSLDGKPLPARLGGPIRFFLHDAETCRGHGDAPCANVKDLAEIQVR
ncbi:MAG: molybdopterin-dependent oxidoreductase [Deltaproteobacteria bacterium]|nr:molybdopterin-dependent oxidoreductase [Deltaproteobacteria bacterium]